MGRVTELTDEGDPGEGDPTAIRSANICRSFHFLVSGLLHVSSASERLLRKGIPFLVVRGQVDRQPSLTQSQPPDLQQDLQTL
jgi:hypothetical protein